MFTLAGKFILVAGYISMSIVICSILEYRKNTNVDQDAFTAALVLGYIAAGAYLFIYLFT